MASDQHSEIKQFMQRAASGQSTEGRQLRFDPRTGKFVVSTEHDNIADDIPQMTAEDLRSFQEAPRLPRNGG